MIEIMANINTYVLGKLPALGTNINEDFFASDTEAEVICRHDPSEYIKQRYVDGSSDMAFAFSYYSQAAGPIAARQKLEAIIGVLELDQFTGFLGLPSGRLTVTARPSPVSKAEDGTVIYTSSYKLEYFKEA
jgi:hypothetical protein